MQQKKINKIFTTFNILLICTLNLIVKGQKILFYNKKDGKILCADINYQVKPSLKSPFLTSGADINKFQINPVL